MTLGGKERRSLTLAVLSGEPVTKLAAEYGVARTYIYKLKEEAIRDCEEEWIFWTRVKTLAGEERGE